MSLKNSYQLCEKIARTRALNFYFSFLPLPRAKRQAMCAVYAFMRYCDDLADDPSISDKATALGAWRGALTRLADGDVSSHPMMPAFLDTVETYHIPLEYFHEVINGAEMDLTIERYQTFDDLYRYCYRVASVVGLTCLKVFGCKDEKAIFLGEKCGIAFQLTNIIRDIREDAASGRFYLPQEDLERFHCTEEQLASPSLDPSIVPMLEFQARRAQGYYEQALPLIELAERDSQASLSAMICIYHGLLRQINAQHFDVFSRRVSLPTPQKLGIAARCWMAPIPTVQREVKGEGNPGV